MEKMTQLSKTKPWHGTVRTSVPASSFCVTKEKKSHNFSVPNLLFAIAGINIKLLTGICKA